MDETLAQIDVVGEVLAAVDRQLQHGDVGLRKHVRQHRPGAVVQAPAVHVEAHVASSARITPSQ